MTLRSSSNSPFVDNKTPTPDRANAAYLNQIGDEVNPLTVKMATIDPNADVTVDSLPAQTGNAGRVLGTDGSAMSWVPQTGGGSGMTDPLTTAGDIVVRGASATTRKAVGTASQVLRVNLTNADKLEYASLAKGDVGLGNVDNTSDATVLASARAQATALAIALG
jgi:hypothetical protein